jgi:hypothetical protein
MNWRHIKPAGVCGAPLAVDVFRADLGELARAKHVEAIIPQGLSGPARERAAELLRELATLLDGRRW